MAAERFLWCGKFLFNEQREKTSDYGVANFNNWTTSKVYNGRAKRYLLGATEWHRGKKEKFKENKTGAQTESTIHARIQINTILMK